MVTYEAINEAYFAWLVRLIRDGRNDNAGFRYLSLAGMLHDIPFTYCLDMDGNQAIHGTELRYYFGREEGYSDEEVEENLDKRPCTVLEMMVSLASRIESNITGDERYGNRTGEWFNEMVRSLGLYAMDDTRFDAGYVLRCVDRFLCRDYGADGRGGLFTVPHFRYDMRELEIWYQAMAYLNECVYGGEWNV